jgi:hypothetical protein
MKIKKIATVIALVAVTSSANAVVVVSNLAGTFNSHMQRNSLSPNTITEGVFTSGTYAIQNVIDGTLYMSGTMMLNYRIAGIANGHAYDVTYTNVSYNLGSASAESVDQSNPAAWVVKYSDGYSRNISANWGTNKAPAPPTAARDTNGTYLGNTNGNNLGGTHGVTYRTGGTSSCIGSGCALWSPNSFGIEGQTLTLIVDPTNAFKILAANLEIQEVFGTGATYQISTFGTGGEVPVPAAAWLMGSGLIGLMGIKRRRKLH